MIGGAAHERLAEAAEEGLEDVVARAHRAERQIPDDRPLARVTRSGSEPNSSKPNQVPAAAEPGDDLVVDDEYVVGLADVADHRPVLGRRRNHPAGADHRLAEHGADVLGPVEDDLLLDLRGALHLAVCRTLAPGATGSSRARRA